MQISTSYHISTTFLVQMTNLFPPDPNQTVQVNTVQLFSALYRCTEPVLSPTPGGLSPPPRHWPRPLPLLDALAAGCCRGDP